MALSGKGGTPDDFTHHEWNCNMHDLLIDPLRPMGNEEAGQCRQLLRFDTLACVICKFETCGS